MSFVLYQFKRVPQNTSENYNMIIQNYSFSIQIKLSTPSSLMKFLQRSNPPSLSEVGYIIIPNFTHFFEGDYFPL